MDLDQIDAAFYYVATDTTVRPERLLDQHEILTLVQGSQPICFTIGSRWSMSSMGDHAPGPREEILR